MNGSGGRLFRSPTRAVQRGFQDSDFLVAETAARAMREAWEGVDLIATRKTEATGADRTFIGTLTRDVRAIDFSMSD